MKISISNFKFLVSNFKSQQGFSILEIILAAAMFFIFATSITVVITQSYNANRLGQELTVATQFASEGLEASRSIKNQAYIDLVNSSGTGVIRNGSNVWAYSGVSNTLIHNATDNFIRVITVEDVRRDQVPPMGNIVSSGGTVDSNSKKVTSTVTWNFNAARPERVALITYLTDWKKIITGNGLLVYGDGTTMPKFRIYETPTNNFSASTNTVTGTSGVSYALRTSPIKTEAIVGYVTATGTLQIMCFNGNTWTNEWSIAVGGTGTTRRFDITYETTTGDVMVVYSRNVAGANALAYRTKSGASSCGGANWAGAVNFAATPAATTGTVQWVRAARDPRAASNINTVIWSDSNSDLGVNNWSGSAWATGVGTFKVLETSLEFVTAAQDVDNSEVVFESLTGNQMVVWGTAAGANGTNGARYARCTGGVYTCSWTAATAVPSVSDDVHTIDMTANPNTNQIVYAAIGNAGDDLTAAYWSGSAWTGYANLGTTAESPAAGRKLVSTAWLINGATTRWILNYDDASGVGLDWYQAIPGSIPIKQTDFNTDPNINDIRQRYDSDMDPVNMEQAMVTVSDSTRAIYAKRASMSSTGIITWSNADGGASLGTVPVVPQQGFSFMYWRFQL